MWKFLLQVLQGGNLLRSLTQIIERFILSFLVFVVRASVFLFFARLGMASSSSRSLLPGVPDLRVRPPSLGPLRDGLLVFALFTILLVVFFLPVYLFLLLALLTHFCLTSSSPSVAISCSSCWPPCGVRRPPPRALVFILCLCPGGMRRPKNAY